MGAALEPVQDAIVVIDNGKIVSVGPSGQVPVPDSAEVVDATGQALLPGFIDAHVHIGFYEPRDIVAGGVTTVRDLGWPPEPISALSQRSRSSEFEGPTVIAAGPMLTAPGGYPSRAGWAPEGTALELPSVAAARAAVEMVTGAGFCIVKVALNPPVGPVLDLDTLSAITTAAHAHGLKVTAHIYGLDELHKALEAGIDELAHMLMSDESIPEDTLDRMVDADVRVVPTLSCFSGSGLSTAIDNLSRFLSAGGNVVYGTDLGNEGPVPGIDRHEVQAMSDAGMTGIDIIRSATVDSAGWLGLGPTGVIAEGSDADLLTIDGDPIVAASSLTNVAMVWRKGRLVKKES